MDQEKFGKFIKDIRKKNNLTQKQLADKYNVTYQAVSKWENGKNMPDILLIRQMSADFNISLEEMLDCELKKTKIKNKNIILIILFVIFVIILSLLIMFIQNKSSDFQFKTLSSNCADFNISGNIAYNDKKTSIYITNIKYCGGDDTKEYEEIECILYESNNETERKISSYRYTDDKNITLEQFLQNATITITDYKKNCNKYFENNLYLLVNARDKNSKTTMYKIPLSLEESCSN